MNNYILLIYFIYCHLPKKICEASHFEESSFVKKILRSVVTLRPVEFQFSATSESISEFDIKMKIQFC